MGTNEITGHKVAVKIMRKNKIRALNMYEKIKREIRIGKFFNHPHIVKLYQYIDSAQYIFVVIELAAGGELFELISRKEKVRPSAF